MTALPRSEILDFCPVRPLRGSVYSTPLLRLRRHGNQAFLIPLRLRRELAAGGHRRAVCLDQLVS